MCQVIRATSSWTEGDFSQFQSKSHACTLAKTHVACVKCQANIFCLNPSVCTVMWIGPYWTYRMQMSTFKIPLDTFSSKWPRVVKSVTQNQEVMRACYRWIFLEQFLQHWQNIMRYGRIFASGYQYSITENRWVAKDWLWLVGFTINFKYIYLYQFGWNIEWSQFEIQKLFAVWKGALLFHVMIGVGDRVKL